MTSVRQKFLQFEWTPYPTSLELNKEFLCGRIQSLDSVSIDLLCEGRLIEINKRKLSAGQNDDLGMSIPVECLAIGDVVALSEKQLHLFLLSPCLQPCSRLFDSRVGGWSDFTASVSLFFKAQGLIEVRTPYLVPSPGVDHHIDYFKVDGSRSEQSFYLPTSPEMGLKKLLCQGYEQIFEIKHTFRDDLVGPHHINEFLMIEWYRSYAPLTQLHSDIVGLIKHLTGKTIELGHLTVAQCFADVLGFTLTPSTSAEELKQLATDQGISVHSSDDWNDLFFRVFIEKIEPYLKELGPTILSDFPAQQASLSQISAQGWSQRFEFYWHGVELANAYLEVNDPVINRDRFNEQQELRKNGGDAAAGWDEDFFSHLMSGMPPASGIALGLDRLYMVLNESEDLSGDAWRQSP